MSGLPSGYTKLEYIQSSGNQWINTGFTPKSTTRVKMSAKFLGGTTGSALFGARSEPSGVDSKSFTLFVVSQKPRSDYFGSSKFGAQTVSASQVKIDWNKNVCMIDSDTITHTATSAASNQVLYIFAVNTAGSATFPASMQLYSCAIYDNGTLVRDFIPCKNASGAVGLYDTVGRQFYANAGTGTFTAGPEILPPAAPTGLQTVLAVVLQWAASANADRYDVYRDGAKLGSTETTQYVDTTPEANQTYVYTVKAVNGGGESAGASITVYTKSGYFEYKPLIESANFP